MTRDATAGVTAPASFAQERLWILDQYQPAKGLYNVPIAWRLEGALDVSALDQSIRALVRRHESLRTTFEFRDGKLCQEVHAFSDAGLSVQDCVLHPTDAQNHLVEEAKRPFDLSTGPLIRACLIKCGPQDCLLGITLHHAVCDAWSIRILAHELSILYRAISTKQEATLPQVTVQCREYSMRQREESRRSEIEAQLKYWIDRLSGAPPLLDLPTDQPRQNVASQRGARYQFVIPDDICRRVRDLCTARRCTLFVTLAAVLNVLLYRYSMQDDICIGYAVANRHADVESVIGCLVNTLVLRTKLHAAQGFDALLREVREAILGGLEFPDAPFEKIVERLQPQRALSHSPVFQVMFGIDDASDGDLVLDGLRVTPLPIHTDTAKFDLSFGVMEKEGALHMVVDYNSELFGASTIARMGRHYRQILEVILEFPGIAIGRIPMLPPEKAAGLQSMWSGHRLEVDTRLCLHELFQNEAALNPEAPAVAARGESLTYQQLNCRSNRLARYLRHKGVGPEQIVAIYVNRSIDLVVAMMAVLKCGAAYLPLDPDFPTARVAFMLADTHSRLVITDSHGRGRLAGFARYAVLVDELADELAEEVGSDLGGIATPDYLAYCIYTSGSTGRPKGVAITHSNAVSLIEWVRREFSREIMSRVVFATSICFDLSIFEVFATLSHGGCVLLANDALSIPNESHISHPTLINTVPSAARALLEMGTMPSSILVLNLAGEPLSNRLARQVRATLPKTLLYNLYGPSEYTTYASHAAVSGEGNAPITIGRPIANTDIFILDEALNPVPIGVIGELYIAGYGLARGYLGRPDLTAERFVPNPYGSPGSRMYRTGDMGRWLPDGRIDFRGRTDYQVKIRGYRVELAEVEAALLSQADVQEAVAVAFDGANGAKQLACYVVPRDGVELTAFDLRAMAHKALPHYMVPVAWNVLSSLPLNSNGKLDRSALPQPDMRALRAQGEFVAPKSETEKLIAGMWRELLGLDRVSLEDNFFDLGGHSLLAIQFLHNLHSLTGLRMPVHELVIFPTIATLAAQIDGEYGGLRTALH